MRKEAENNLYQNLMQASILIKKPLLAALWQFKITPEQWEIIQLVKSEPLSQSDIVRKVMKDKGNISRILARLKRDNWIELIPNTSPKKHQLSLKAEQLYKDIMRALAPYYDRLLRDLGSIRGDNLNHCLQKLIKEL